MAARQDTTRHGDINAAYFNSQLGPLSHGRLTQQELLQLWGLEV